MKPTLHLIAGARPNFMKLAPIVRALKAQARLDFRIIHTGQHHDREMNEVFFEELGIPAPDVHLHCGGGGHAEQTGKVMVAYEALCKEERPDATLVVGDVNSTLACALVAKKLQIPVAHVEAGLRSGDMAMPEEINRLATDAICDWWFVTEPSGIEHLKREGKPSARVHEVGNVMVDNLLFQAAQLERLEGATLATDEYKRAHPRYGVVTLHRPSNVDDPETFARLAQALREIAAELPLIFPVHPRTRANMEKFGIHLGANVTLIGPQGYMPFLHLWKDAAVVLTDSGGLQEETTALGVQCVTLRENTERPVTITEGTNVLAGTDPVAIVNAAGAAIAKGTAAGRRPKLWDGRAAERIAETLARALVTNSEGAIVEGVAPGVERIDVLGVPVDNLTMEETLQVIEGFIDSGEPHQHVVVNVDKLVKARKDEQLKGIISRCALINADGMPVVWASRLLGTPLKERVAGVDLFDSLMARAAQKGWRPFLLGAKEEVVSKVREIYQARYPNLEFAGHRNGYWTEAEEPKVAEMVRDARADLLFVAISSPKKERFLGQWQRFMRVPFAMGVGGTFDVAAGYVKRAPVFFQRTGMEWFWRFLQEPTRMFRRYFVEDMAFIGILGRAMYDRRKP
ncbi:MAG TPA: UDP-N-acetylglucosamine 2-epimerase (non-hydrolyzing) [Usitatibacter sp.]|nr:UDP-N-acetylglucosamine 2-epimerase (non-hydrolyzing) [Usitatibacter sp.]